MAYQFPPEVDQLVKRQLASGQYGSEDDVLLEALRSLQRQQAERAAIQEGIHDINAQRVKPIREFDREFREKKNIPQDV